MKDLCEHRDLDTAFAPIIKHVEAWRDEEKGNADKSYEHARPYILAETRMKCYQDMLNLINEILLEWRDTR